MVGAVLQPAHAQVRDTITRRDTSRAQDTTAARRAGQGVDATRRDTVKAALAESERPVLADPSGSFHWNRRGIFATGAITVQDLLDRVPGLTGLRANWIGQPIMAAHLGDLRRIRLFLDGLELEEFDPRMGRIWDLSQIPLWSLDDLVVERTAAEVRIHMRSWRVDRTTPFSRTDIYTGDQSTNLYRGLFGRRYRHGEALQVAGQQFSTIAGRFAESSDQLGFMSRLGIGRPSWTADAVVLRQSRNRGRSFALTLSDTVPDTESVRWDAYLRLAWRDTAAGLWAQGLAGASTYQYAAPRSTAGADTTLDRTQYLLTGGYTAGPLRASVTQRFLSGSLRRVATPSARLSWEAGRLVVSAFAEGRGLDSTRRFDLSATLRPFGWIFLAGSVATERRLSGTDAAPAFARVEAGIRVRDLWLSAGGLSRDPVELDGTVIATRPTRLIQDSAITGAFATIRGRLFGAVYLDAHGTRWNDTIGVYRPQYQTRSELYLSTAALRRFPTGNFHVRASVIHEYRSALLWPDSAGFTRAPGHRTWSTYLQFKIVSADVFWRYQNILNERYPEIPGYRLPRLTSIYGVRWEFWN